jgi:hypothetical protein
MMKQARRDWEYKMYGFFSKKGFKMDNVPTIIDVDGGYSSPVVRKLKEKMQFLSLGLGFVLRLGLVFLGLSFVIRLGLDLGFAFLGLGLVFLGLDFLGLIFVLRLGLVFLGLAS